MTTAEPETAPPGAPATARWEERMSTLSDRCNPILVREIQQSLRGKAFIVTLSISLAAIVVTALVVAGEGRTGQGVGQDYFSVALTLLTPIALFIIPLQACLSMQQELRGGSGEQLLLSRLTPRRIVRGKLLAAMVQFSLFASVFGPLLALTFLLRGVDVPTIVFFMVAGMLGCLTASALAIAVGALGRARMLTTFLLAGTAVALGTICVAIMADLWWIVREVSSEMQRGEFWLITLLAANMTLVALALFGLIARSLLTHPNENRSTPFRAFPFAVMLVAVVWTVCVVPPRDLSEAARYLAIFAIVGMTPFWLFAVTEEPDLSPRARSMVPRAKWLAWLVAPLLPGSGRGVVFVALSSAWIFAFAGGLELLCVAKGYPVHSRWPQWPTVLVCWGYCVGYTALGRPIRARLPRGVAATWTARVAVPALVVLGCVLPMFADIMIQGRVTSWSPLHLGNPFWTMDRGVHDADWFVAVLGFGLAALAISLPAAGRGIREVLDASRRRRGSQDAA